MQIKLLTLAIFAFLVVASFAQPKLVLVGGGLNDNNTEIWDRFLELSTPESGEQLIGIVTAATEYAEEDWEYYEDLLPIAYDIKNLYWVPINLNTTENAFNETVIAQINNLTGIWFAGGDQSNIVTCFYYTNGTNTHTPTPALAAIQARYQAGQVAIGGSSAGCAIQQGTPMVTGGESWNALVYGSFPYVNDKEPDNLSYDINGGFGFSPNVFVDMHVGTRGRQGRMLRLVWDLKNYTNYSLGVDENTAMIIQNNVGTVYGANGAYIIDITKARPAGTGFGLDSVYITYLTEGDVYYFDNNTAQPASWKSNVAGHQTYLQPYAPTFDIFSSSNDPNSVDETFTNYTTNFMNSHAVKTYGLTYESHPTYRLDFVKDQYSQAYFGCLGGTNFLSYINMKVKVFQGSGDIEDDSFLELLIE
jgi:cyanophycinase